MGYLDEMLAAVDNIKRVGARNISDLASDPVAYAEKIAGHLRNQNANVVPTAAGGELTNRPMTQDEIIEKYVGMTDPGKGVGTAFAGITSSEALREARRFAGTLKGKEREALAHYTNTESPWHAAEVNYALRKGIPIPPDAQEYINTLTNILRKAPKSDTPFELHRGMPAEHAFAGKPDPAFMSVTTSPGVAESYAEMIMDNAGRDIDELGQRMGAVRSFHAPKGTPMVDPDVDKFWDDSELLMPKGSTITPPGNEIFSNKGKLILPQEFR
jgi:hypothetical protein